MISIPYYGTLKAVNRLKNSKSVYLKQHQNNPVDWWSWGDDAFAEARKKNQLLFVSIGYSTCHWCHVMEHECFEDSEVAQALNTNFISIKVDREEHPEVDRFFMDTLLRIQGHGGWPLNMFVLPDGKPFVGGTYFPKQNFLNTLKRIQEIWSSTPDTIEKQAAKVLESLADEANLNTSGKNLAEISKAHHASLELLIRQQMSSFDPIWGGFGRAPKFPRSHGLGALLRASQATSTLESAKKSSEAFFHTLLCMGYGGIRDHLGGGFHRYSTDQEWLAPHFEKMLYDQALLIDAYAEGYSASRSDVQRDFHRDMVRSTFEYCERELKQSNGLFGAGEDADSEGVEGKFYVWSLFELQEILSSESELSKNQFFKLYQPLPHGNWEHSNILRLMPSDLWSDSQNPEMIKIRQKLFDIRARRPRPILDSKAIVEWNALLALGFLRASFELAPEKSLSESLFQSGSAILDTILKKVDGDFDRIPRIFYHEEFSGSAYLVDSAALALALQYRASLSLDVSDLKIASDFLIWMIGRFRVEGASLANRWRSSAQNEGIPARPIDEDDGATPSTLGLLAGSLLRGARLHENSDFMEAFIELFPMASANLERYPSIHSFLINELDGLKAPLIKIPSGEREATLKALAGRGVLLSQVIFKSGTRFEICSWELCDWTGESLADFLTEFDRRLSKN